MQVLAAGGTFSQVPIATSEIDSPTSGIFSSTGIF